LLFVKELGPTAQKIAAQKMQGLQENPQSCQTECSNNWVQAMNYQVPAAHAPNLNASRSLDSFDGTMSLKFTDSVSGRCSVLETTAETIDFRKPEEQRRVYGKERTSYLGASIKQIFEYNEASSLPAGINVLGAPRRGRIVQNHKSKEFCLGSGSSDTSARDLNSSIVSTTSSTAKSTSLMIEAGTLDETVRPVILALEHSHAHSSESKWRNKKSSTPSTWFSQGRASASQTSSSRNSFSTCNQPIRATEEKNGDGSRHETRQSPLKQSITTPIPHPVSGFTFDMHFLKAKLNQMKDLGRDREFQLNKQGGYQTSLDAERGFIEQGSYGYRGASNNSSCSRQSETGNRSFPYNESFDTLDAKLALQL
jgi:bromodomain-containing protein 9